MKKLLVYFKSYTKEAVLGPLFKLLEASFELFVPLVVASMIDFGIAEGKTDYIIRSGLILVLLGVIGLICSITAQFFAAKAAVGFATKLRHVLFEHIQKLSFTDIDKLGTSKLISRMTSDINQVQSGTNLVLRLFLRSPFIVFGAMFMAFMTDAKLAVYFVIVIPLLSVIVFGIMLLNIPMYKNVQNAFEKVTAITRENLTGVRVIRAFGNEEDEIKEFDERNQFLMKIQLHAGRISAVMNPLTYIVVNAGIVALVYSGAIRVNLGLISTGTVVALVNYMSQILVELVKLANLIINVTKAIACGNRIQAVLEIPVEEDAGTEGAVSDKEKAAPFISFRNVSFAYPDAGGNALSAITFDVKKGETIGIIGGTGSGKSTLVSLIPGFYKVSGGELLIDGINVNDYSKKELRNKVGNVMQKAVLFKGTIRSNLLWGNENASEEELTAALKTAQAYDFVMEKDGKMDAEVTQGGNNLSGGQKQRLTIARALVRKPEILIMDDSASALDYATDAALRHDIGKLDKDMTVFIVSQRTSSIRTADRIIVLDDGKIVGSGTHDELLENCEIYREIYASQYGTENRG